MATKVYTLEDIKEHRTEESCWLAIHGKVYDVTDFLEEHPGGFEIMKDSAGEYCLPMPSRRFRPWAPDCPQSTGQRLFILTFTTAGQLGPLPSAAASSTTDPALLCPCVTPPFSCSPGKDATQDYEDIGHSQYSHSLLPKYLIGEYEGGDTAPPPPVKKVQAVSQGPSAVTRTFQVLLPLIVILLAVVLNSQFGGK